MTPRVALAALVLIPLNAWWLIETEYIRYSDNATTQALFFNAISLLLLLTGLNRLLRRLRPGWALTPSELTLLYVGVVAASNLAGHDVLQVLFTTIAYIHHQAGVDEGWRARLLPHVPPNLTITDPEALRGLFSGNTTLYRWDHLQPLLVPLGLWTAFTFAIVWTLFCLSALLRKQWASEKLSYPMVELPLAIVSGERAFFRQPVLWVGFGIGAACQLINMVHALVPSLPGIPTGVQYYRFETFPWNAAGSIPVCLFPFALGLSFLLPTQLGFSCWFFFLLSRAELVLAAKAGYVEWGKFPYVQQQGVGAVYGVAAVTLWTARGHLARVWQKVLGEPGGEDDTDEPLPYRLALLGFLGGVVALVGFVVWAGMSLSAALWFFGLLLTIILVVARLRAELGLPTFELYLVGPDHIVQTALGNHGRTPAEWSVMTLLFWLERTHRQFPMQNQVEAIELARRTRTSPRAFSAFFLAASFLGILSAFWALAHSTYRAGFESGKFLGPAMWAFGRAPWQMLDTRLVSPLPPDPGAVAAYGFGAVFALFLAAMRLRFTSWPFHPAGYLVAGSYGLFRLWVPIFLAWLLKALILRYGGLGLYRRALPFFLGLILGEFSAGFLRGVLDLAFGLYLPPESGIGGL